MEHLDTRRLQRSEEGWEIGGGLGQHLVDDCPEQFFLRGPPDSAQPLSIVAELGLAVLPGFLDNGKRVLDTHPVREPPQGKGGAQEVAELPGAIQ